MNEPCRCVCDDGGLRRVRDLMREDIETYLAHAADYQTIRATWRARLSALLTPQVLCVCIYRVSHLLYRTRWRRCARLLEDFNLVVHKLRLASASCIGPGLYIPHPVSIIFEGNAGCGLILAAKSACVPAEPWQGVAPAAMPRLGDDVALGGTSLVQGPVQIGNRCRLGMQAVVMEDLPAATTVVARAFRARVVRKPE